MWCDTAGPGGVFGGFVKATYSTSLKGQYIGIDDSDIPGKGGVQVGDSYHDDINIGLVYVSSMGYHRNSTTTATRHMIS